MRKYLADGNELLRAKQRLRLQHLRHRSPLQRPPLLQVGLTDSFSFDNINNFLNSPAVQKALNVSIQWEACNDDQVYSHLEGDFERSYGFDIPTILSYGVPVTVYNGNLDIICNFYGNSGVDGRRN